MWSFLAKASFIFISSSLVSLGSTRLSYSSPDEEMQVSRVLVQSSQRKSWKSEIKRVELQLGDTKEG